MGLVYLPIHGWLIFHGFHVGKYTIQLEMEKKGEINRKSLTKPNSDPLKSLKKSPAASNHILPSIQNKH